MSTTYLLSGKESVDVLHSVEICSVQGILAGEHLRKGREKYNEQHINFNFCNFTQYLLLFNHFSTHFRLCSTATF